MKKLFKALYPLEYPLVIIAHIIYGAWVVGLLAFFGVLENIAINYYVGIPIVVLLLAVFFRRPKKRRPEAPAAGSKFPGHTNPSHPPSPRFPPVWKKGGQDV